LNQSGIETLPPLKVKDKKDVLFELNQSGIETPWHHDYATGYHFEFELNQSGIETVEPVSVFLNFIFCLN